MSATVDNAAAGALADGVGQVGDELLNNERRLIREPRYLIQVSPQRKRSNYGAIDPPYPGRFLKYYPQISLSRHAVLAQ